MSSFNSSKTGVNELLTLRSVDAREHVGFDFLAVLGGLVHVCVRRKIESDSAHVLVYQVRLLQVSSIEVEEVVVDGFVRLVHGLSHLFHYDLYMTRKTLIHHLEVVLILKVALKGSCGINPGILISYSQSC